MLAPMLQILQLPALLLLCLEAAGALLQLRPQVDMGMSPAFAMHAPQLVLPLLRQYAPLPLPELLLHDLLH